MTPQEKAKELVDKFMPHSSGNSNNNEAKQCALIANQEALDVAFMVINEELITYYLEVKQEIEKL